MAAMTVGQAQLMGVLDLETDQGRVVACEIVSTSETYGPCVRIGSGQWYCETLLGGFGSFGTDPIGADRGLMIDGSTGEGIGGANAVALAAFCRGALSAWGAVR